MFWNEHRRAAGLIGLAGVAVLVAACATGTEMMKKDLEEFGKIDAEWEIRDEAEQKTYTYLLLRAESGVHETYVIVAEDRQRMVMREQVGGIDGTGCYLLDPGLTTPWVAQLPPATLQETTRSGAKTRTRCLEYKDGVAWNFVPQKDRKAAEPPPPPPKPAASPDMGTSDAGDEPAEDKGEVKSAIP